MYLPNVGQCVYRSLCFSTLVTTSAVDATPSCVSVIEPVGTTAVDACIDATLANVSTAVCISTIATLSKVEATSSFVSVIEPAGTTAVDACIDATLANVSTAVCVSLDIAFG
jgi:predicted thioesterase